MIRIQFNIRPPNGWEFKERDGTVIRAGSWRGVIKKVVHYRLLNRFPPGDPTTEVTAQACHKNPSSCYDDKGSWRHPAAGGISLKARVLKWLSELSKVTPAYVPSADAKQRADICMRCPNQSAVAKGCSTCHSAVKALEEQNLRGRAADPRLLHCSVLGHDLKVAVWIADSRLNNPHLPGSCWRKAQ
jgi:hypothetical protein